MSSTRLIIGGLISLGAAYAAGTKLQIKSSDTTSEGDIIRLNIDKKLDGSYTGTNILYHKDNTPAEHLAIHGNYDPVTMVIPNDKNLVDKAVECFNKDIPVQITYNTFLFTSPFTGARKQVVDIKPVNEAYSNRNFY